MTWVNHNLVKNAGWLVFQSDDGTYSQENVDRAIMLDIRDYMRRMVAVLECHNTIEIPRILRRIEKNTAAVQSPRRQKQSVHASRHHRIRRAR